MFFGVKPVLFKYTSLQLNRRDEIIILDFDTVPPEPLEEIFLAKNDQAAVIGCFTPDNYSILIDNYHLFDQVWIQPFSKNKVYTQNSCW